MRKGYPSDIKREQFEAIRPLLESARRKTAPRKVELYEVFCAVLYLLRTGCQWRALPSDFPKWRTVHSYFAIWSEPREGAGHGRVQSLLCDSGYRGKPFAQGVQEIVGGHVTVQIAKRSELHTFKVMPKRWIVERSFAWLEKNRRLWKNCERWLNTSLQFVHLAFLGLLLRRL